MQCRFQGLLNVGFWIMSKKSQFISKHLGLVLKNLDPIKRRGISFVLKCKYKYIPYIMIQFLNFFQSFSKSLKNKLGSALVPVTPKRLMSKRKPVIATPFSKKCLFYGGDVQKLIMSDNDKGQLISEWNFGVFKSSKKWTFFLTDFCPSL